jgi:DNA-binding MarR family transcriptional regulator
MEDGRGVIVGLTSAGEKTVAELLRGVNQREKRWIASLSRTDREHLAAILRRLMHRDV